jgi:hypothetical protein
MAVRQQQRRGTEAQWTSANPILAAGEIGFETDTNKFKIGDGTNRWASLTYFTADAAAAIQDLIDGAPGILDTLNELAAAVGDDANFFATVTSNIAAAKSEAISTASSDATTKANNAKSGAETTASADATAKANAAQAAAEATASADATSKSATAKSEAIAAAAADATTKANAAKTAAEATAAAALSSAIATEVSDRNSAISSAIATEVADRDSAITAAVAAVVDSAPAALDTLNELAAALADSPDTVSNLTTLVGTKADSSALSSHESQTINVHGIADTSILATTTGTQTLTNKTLTSPVINGATVGGNIVPSADNTYDLGSPTSMWKDIYVGPGSLYVNGQKVLQDESGAIVVSADINENLGLRTSGSGNIELDPTGTGSINLKGAVVVEAGANITSNDGNGINFGSRINADSITSKSTNTDLSLSGNGTGKVYLNDNTEVGGNLTVTGNLSVGGTVTTINSETISLADNIIDLNSNFTTGNPTENSGIRVVRGDEANVQVRWNETADKWQFTNDGSVFSDIAPAQSPTFTGTPAAPTASVGTDTTQVATTAFVKAAIQDISSLNLVLDGGGV